MTNCELQDSDSTVELRGALMVHLNGVSRPGK